MVLQFVGEYVVAFLRKTLHENEGFFVLKMFWFFARKDAKAQRNITSNLGM
jgi:hypothetical protein